MAPPDRLTTEYSADPVGIDVAVPRLSWQILTAHRGHGQSAYQIQVANSREDLIAARTLRWDSGQVASNQSTFVPYAGPALGSSERVYWRVRVWDETGKISTWSEPSFLETGLLRPQDWRAKWITATWPEDRTHPAPSPYFRKGFEVHGEIRSARLYITALGLYEARINGQRVGDALLTPGWTSYDHRISYQTFDVTQQLRPGANALGAVLGSGWYRGALTWESKRNIFGDQLALLAQLRIVYADGREEIIGTDPSWKAAKGPILYSEIYAGESYDARLERAGWDLPGADEHDWSPVAVVEHTIDTLVAQYGPLIRGCEEVKPVSLKRGPDGDTIIDFGQNLVGFVRFRVRGAAGSTVTLRHGELLDGKGRLYTANLRAADQKITYVLKGDADETFSPHFTFQGFRYVSLAGYPGEAAADAFTAIVVHSDAPITGNWESSDPRLNRLYQNIVWSQKGNFVGVPTDCPQRDERLGWTGDAQVFARTASFNMNVGAFFTRWLRDVAADQKADGCVPWVVPDVLSRNEPTTPGSAGWSDVAVVVPWTLHLVYGDRRVLENQYDSMKRWVEYIRGRAVGDLWNSGYHWGDWLAYAPARADYPGATTSKELVATAYYAHAADLLARAARVLGREQDAQSYAELFERVRAAFQREFVTPGGRVGESTQTAYALALQFDLLPAAARPEAARRLAADVAKFDNHLTTGFIGTPLLCFALSENEHLDTAYALLMQDTYPSWLYPVKMGATTIWERWNSLKPDGTPEGDGMNSYNHYAYGAVGEWLFRVAAGIDTDPQQPGYQHSVIRPRPGGGLTHVRASYETLYGTLLTDWTLTNGRMHLVVKVPANTRASIWLPNAEIASVQENHAPLAAAAGVRDAKQDGADVRLEAGAGEYEFDYAWPAPKTAAPN
jgi:alpha-L-rhamnosidase